MKTYTVELENYNGPLDVLLQLIQRQKLDVCDINLASVTNDYLQFMKNTKLDQHSANQFLEIAVKLILYKSKALLPNQDAIQSEEEIEDLTEQLRTLSLYQHASRNLMLMQKNALLPQPTINTKSTISNFSNLSKDSILKSYKALVQNTQILPKKVFHLKRQSNERLKKELLGKLERINSFEISSLNTLGRTKQEVIMLFMIILNLISSDKADLSANSKEYKVVINT